MSKFKYLLLLLIIIVSAVLFQNHRLRSAEKDRAECINNLLIAKHIDGIEVDYYNRGTSPVLQGTITADKKQLLLQTLNNQCGISEFQDFINIIEDKHLTKTWLNFSIDNINNIITLLGTVATQNQLDDILEGFANSLPELSIAHDVSVDESISNNDFAMTITLVLATLTDVQMADITLGNGEIIIKGLVRDRIQEKLLMDKLQSMFSGEKKIINQLEQVVENDSDRQELEFKLAPLPQLQQEN
jgi:hypothetical protein